MLETCHCRLFECPPSARAWLSDHLECYTVTLLLTKRDAYKVPNAKLTISTRAYYSYDC